MDLYSPRHTLIVLIMLALAWVVVGWPYARIFSRAGYSKWLSLLILIPLVNLITIWWFAFADWNVKPSGQQTT